MVPPPMLKIASKPEDVSVFHTPVDKASDDAEKNLMRLPAPQINMCKDNAKKKKYYCGCKNNIKNKFIKLDRYKLSLQDYINIGIQINDRLEERQREKVGQY